MSAVQIIFFLLALINLIVTTVLIYFKKSNWAVALGILEIVLVIFALTP